MKVSLVAKEFDQEALHNKGMFVDSSSSTLLVSLVCINDAADYEDPTASATREADDGQRRNALRLACCVLLSD